MGVREMISTVKIVLVRLQYSGLVHVGLKEACQDTVIDIDSAAENLPKIFERYRTIDR